jgi:hypothetical protein
LDNDIVPDPSQFALPLYGKQTFSRFTLNPNNLLQTTTLGVVGANTSLTVDYRYGGINRLVTEDYTGTGGVETGYLYDSCTYGIGRLCQATSTSATSTYAYNALGKVASETKRIAGNNYLTQYVIDRLGNVNTVTYPNGISVKYNYNSAGLVDSVVQSSATSSAYSYLVDALDYGPTRQLIYQLDHNSTASYFTYDPNELYRLVNKTTVGPKSGGMGFMMMFESPTGESLAFDSGALAKTMFLDPSEYLKQGLATTTDSGDVLLIDALNLPEKRTETSDTSLVGFNKEGVPIYRTRLFTSPANYFDPATKTLQPIQISLDKTDSGFEVTKAPYHAKITPTFGTGFLTFINGMQEIAVTALKPGKTVDVGVQAVGEWANKEAYYVNALGDGLDIDIHFDDSAVKKEIVINSLASLGDIASSSDFEVPFKLTSNHPLDVVVEGKRLSEMKTVTSDRPAQLVDDSGAVTYVRAPIASYHRTDLPDQFINIPIRYELVDGEILMTKLLPLEWLKSANYPVRADATFSTYDGIGDGHVAYSNDASLPSWSTVHDSNGNTAKVTANYNIPEIALQVDSAGGSNSFELFRDFFPFDTSALPDTAVPTAANLNLYINSVHVGGSLDIYVVGNTAAATSSLTNLDYPRVGSTAFSSSYPGTGLTTSAYNAFALNAAGLSAISTTGWTQLALREKNDFDNVAPTGQTVGVWTGIAGSGATGTSTDPYLDITYTLAGSNEPTMPTSLQAESLNNPSNVSDQTPETSSGQSGHFFLGRLLFGFLSRCLNRRTSQQQNYCTRSHQKRFHKTLLLINPDHNPSFFHF